MELNNAVNGTSHDLLGGSNSILPSEFVAGIAHNLSDEEKYAQFYVGVNTERMSGVNQALLTGQSTALTPISLNIRCNEAATATIDGTVTPLRTTCNLLTIFDGIIQVNLASRSASLKV